MYKRCFSSHPNCMITLFSRTIITYLIVFAVMRLMGKRQLSDMQPFDLVVTLLIADVASVPISDMGIPLFYGIIPILALFLLHRLVSFAALKSDRIRTLVCGKPVILIADGVIQEDALRAASCTISDLTEQLRLKDVFSLSEVSYCLLETNGSLSVMKKQDGKRNRPSVMLVCDGRTRKDALRLVNMDEKALNKKLKRIGVASPKDLIYACIDDDGTLYAQTGRSYKSGEPVVLELKNKNENDPQL